MQYKIKNVLIFLIYNIFTFLSEVKTGMTYDVYMPVRCIYGNNAVTGNSGIFSSFGKRCLIVTGRSGAKKSGALDDAVQALKSEGIDYDIFDGITENPLISSCCEAGRRAYEFKADFILGIGGGSAQDASKAIAFYATNPGFAPADIYGKDKGCIPPLPVILIGTTAGTGSEVTAVSVLTNDETGIKKSVKGPDCYAKVSFCDPKYTYSLPYGYTVSTALDAFHHAIEGFFTVKCEGVERIYAEKAIPMIYSCLKKLAETDEVDIKLRDPLYYGSIYAGLVINTCGTGFPHPMGYVLTENYGVPHGTACAAFFTDYIDRCKIYSAEKAEEFFSMTDKEEKVREVITSLIKLDGIRFDAELAHKYSARWETVIPVNFTASPGGLTREEAEQILLKFSK